ncbi:ribosome recycling factor [Hydrogenobacter thermophilus TK-6]|uniref:Ribosome-recycling factor n=1 Tax=Hydrogenobacter thermophilus (strain DSM 6534 / IAM 12695 / TK-6) TaxID=608538 RepID=D3DH49_HYDTT|nr:ribosome recycling factor [Hydrogenobacter thermophilus]ADO45088.1 ribosome recycling factor [Hydrogenobacter thermophilus TK-6]BAI69151.1 ribosome recycling factor [Hydrogenobacter thermophilus TK-6]
MMEDIFKSAEEDMKKAVNHFKNEIGGLRTGRASTALVEELKVEYYGSKVPIKQLGSISVPEANQIVLQLWDSNAVPNVEKVIMEELGLNPQRQGNTLRIILPPLTEERRKELVRLLHKMAEEARVAIRNIRRDAKEMIEELEGVSEDEIKRALDRLQKLTDRYIDQINHLVETKEKEIMEL